MTDTTSFHFVLGMPSYRFGLTQQIYRLLRELNLPAHKEIFVNELSVAKARNYIAGLYVKHFAFSPGGESDILVMIDQDTVATISQVRDLLAQCDSANPVIGTNMCYRNNPGQANWFLPDDPDGVKKQKIIQEAETGLIEVEKCGFGLIAIHKSALITMSDRANLVQIADQYVADLFSPVYESSGPNTCKPISLPETYSFCQRARKAGLKIKVDLKIKPGHIQQSVISM